METISPLSKVTPAPDTYSTEISETRVSFQGFYDQNIYTTTPCAPGQRDFSFTINPSPNNEIHLPSCEIVTQFRIKKADGTNIAASNQLGCLQTLGWSMFENSNLRINGNKWLPEVRTVDHWEYIKMMALYSQISKKALFKRAGYREDKLGKTQYTEVGKYRIFRRIVKQTDG